FSLIKWQSYYYLVIRPGPFVNVYFFIAVYYPRVFYKRTRLFLMLFRGKITVVSAAHYYYCHFGYLYFAKCSLSFRLLLGISSVLKALVINFVKNARFQIRRSCLN